MQSGNGIIDGGNNMYIKMTLNVEDREKDSQQFLFIYLFIIIIIIFLSKGQRKGWRLKRKGWRLIWWF